MIPEEELLLDLDGLDHHVILWAIHAVGSHAADLCHNLLGLLVRNLTEDGVAVVQVWGGGVVMKN